MCAERCSETLLISNEPSKWIKILEKASEREKWGQVIEANEQYQLLLKEIRIAITMSYQEELVKDKLAECERLLLTITRNGCKPKDIPPTEGAGFSSRTDSLKEILQSLVVLNDQITPPITPERLSRSANIKITIDKIDVADPDWLNQPFITISVIGMIDGVSDGLIEPTYDTDYSNHKLDNHVIFNEEIELKTSMDRLPKDGRILFELKHYNPSKRRVTTKSMSTLPISGLKEGPVKIETKQNFRAKWLYSMLPVKRRKLYLHLIVTFTCI